VSVQSNFAQLEGGRVGTARSATDHLSADVDDDVPLLGGVIGTMTDSTASGNVPWSSMATSGPVTVSPPRIQHFPMGCLRRKPFFFKDFALFLTHLTL
jgi:hypothetical protein